MSTVEFVEQIIARDPRAMKRLFECLKPLSLEYLRRNASGYDIDLADEVLCRIMLKLPGWFEQKVEKRPRDDAHFMRCIRTFMSRETHAVRREWEKVERHSPVSLDEQEWREDMWVPPSIEVEPPVDLNRSLDWVQTFIEDNLSERDIKIHRALHDQGLDQSTIQRRYGISAAALRKVIERTRKKLAAAAPAWVIETYPGCFPRRQKRSGKTPRRGRG